MLKFFSRLRVATPLLFAFTYAALLSNSAFAAPETIEGTMRVSINDGLDGRTKIVHEIGQNGRSLKLKFRGSEPSGLTTGQRVRISASRLNAETLLVTGAVQSAGLTSTLETAGLSGLRSVLILRIQSSSAISSASEASLASIVNQTRLRYEETSFGALSFTNDRDSNGIPDVYTVTVNQPTSGLAESQAFSLCSTAQSNAASQFGISPSLWNHRICILPPDMAYSWFGTAYIGGSDIVINGNYAGGSPGGYEHEIGHNLGMHHANSGASFPGTEYGDASCVMGGNAGTGDRHFNGPHQVQMGWASASSVGAGSFTINAVETDPSAQIGPYVVLKVRDTVANEDLYVSYRAQIGNYSSGPINAGRTAIHKWSGGASQTLLITTLGDNESFTQNGVTLVQQSHAGSTAQIGVFAQCAPLQPLVTISPPSFVTSTLAPQSFTVTLQNRDANCGASSFSLSSTFPNGGLTATVTPATLTSESGITSTAVVTIAPLSGIVAGSYLATISAEAAGHPTASSSATYTYDNLPPTAPGTLSGVRNGTKAKLTWSASFDSGGAGIQAYDVIRNGSVVATLTQLTFNATLSKGSNVFTVRARDKAGNIGPLSNSVTISR